MFWHPDTTLPIVYKIHKDQFRKEPRHYLDEMMKSKKIVPPPNAYNITKDLTIKNNMITSKSPRITEPVAIEK